MLGGIIDDLRKRRSSIDRNNHLETRFPRYVRPLVQERRRDEARDVHLIDRAEARAENGHLDLRLDVVRILCSGIRRGHVEKSTTGCGRCDLCDEGRLWPPDWPRDASGS
jgi:hypothetical protein